MTKDFIINYLKLHKKEFRDKYGVIKLGLFGSYARNEQSDFSDIDITIEIKKERKNIHTFFSLKREMETAFNKKVDLGIESTLKPIIKEQVIKEILYV